MTKEVTAMPKTTVVTITKTAKVIPMAILSGLPNLFKQSLNSGLRATLSGLKNGSALLSELFLHLVYTRSVGSIDSVLRGSYTFPVPGGNDWSVSLLSIDFALLVLF